MEEIYTHNNNRSWIVFLLLHYVQWFPIPTGATKTSLQTLSCCNSFFTDSSCHWWSLVNSIFSCSHCSCSLETCGRWRVNRRNIKTNSTSLFFSLLSSSTCLLHSFEFLSSCPLAWLSSASIFCSYTAMTMIATPTNNLLPHLSSAGTVVKCSVPSLSYTPVVSAQLAVTSSLAPASAAPVAPGYPCGQWNSLSKVTWKTGTVY